MSSAIQSIGVGTASAHKPQPTFLERLANALVYVIAFPFIAIFIGMKRILTDQKTPTHSYYDKLPPQHLIGQDNMGSATKSTANMNGERPDAAQTRSKKA